MLAKLFGQCRRFVLVWPRGVRKDAYCIFTREAHDAGLFITAKSVVNVRSATEFLAELWRSYLCWRHNLRPSLRRA